MEDNSLKQASGLKGGGGGGPTPRTLPPGSATAAIIHWTKNSAFLKSDLVKVNY